MSARTRLRILAGLTAAFALRVAGQLVVMVSRPAWLPPPEFWQSGLLAYPVLLAAQLAILGAQVVVVRASLASRDALRPGARWAGRVRVFAVVYGGTMALRPLATLALAPDLHPARSLIPSLFHVVLAGFLWVWAGSTTESGSNRSGALTPDSAAPPGRGVRGAAS